MKIKSNFVLITFLLLSLLNTAAYIKKELDADSNKDEKGYILQESSKLDIVPSFAPLILQDQSLPAKEQLLKEEIIRLRKEVSEQKETTSNILHRTEDISNNQSQLLNQSKEIITATNDIYSIVQSLQQYLNYKDAFIFTKEGKPFAYIDPFLKVYEYSGGNLLGWLNVQDKQIVRNYDNSIIATIENDFIIDETGHPIGTIERSETLRLEREKLFPRVQKTPVSHFFNKIITQKQFIQPQYRFTDWSQKRLEDVLIFPTEKIEKLK